MKQPHKNAPHVHAELIKAWADGAEIQFQDSFGNWFDCEDTPRWVDHANYRIKPEPKPDVVEYRFSLVGGSTERMERANLKLIFDGETGKLKSAEVL